MCGGEDLKREMLSSILVVGGGYRFSGAASYLQSRLSQALVNVQCEVFIFCMEMLIIRTRWTFFRVKLVFEFEISWSLGPWDPWTLEP